MGVDQRVKRDELPIVSSYALKISHPSLRKEARDILRKRAQVDRLTEHT